MAELKYGYTLHCAMENYGAANRSLVYELRIGKVSRWACGGMMQQYLATSCYAKFTSFGHNEPEKWGLTFHPGTLPGLFFAPHAQRNDDDYKLCFGNATTSGFEFSVLSSYDGDLVVLVGKAMGYTTTPKFDLNAPKHATLREAWDQPLPYLDNLTLLLYGLHSLGARHMRQTESGTWAEMTEWCQFSPANIGMWMRDTRALARETAATATEPVTA